MTTYMYNCCCLGGWPKDSYPLSCESQQFLHTRRVADLLDTIKAPLEIGTLFLVLLSLPISSSPGFSTPHSAAGWPVRSTVTLW